uniref:Uncharacterized protein n=1 Tax=Glossina pallidipes TaxID=7398 RepID=A0A1A9Z1Y3_GLOPL
MQNVTNEVNKFHRHLALRRKGELRRRDLIFINIKFPGPFALYYLNYIGDELTGLYLMGIVKDNNDYTLHCSGRSNASSREYNVTSTTIQKSWFINDKDPYDLRLREKTNTTM